MRHGAVGTVLDLIKQFKFTSSKTIKYKLGPDVFSEPRRTSYMSSRATKLLTKVRCIGFQSGTMHRTKDPV